MTAHAQPQEMSPDKTLRNGRRRSKSEKPKAAPESPQNRRRKRMFRLTNLWENKKTLDARVQHAPGCSVSRIFGKIRNFGCPCSELKKIHVDGQIVTFLKPGENCILTTGKRYFTS